MGDRFGTEAGAVLPHGIFVFAHFLRAGHDHFTKQHQDYSKGFDFLLKLVKNSCCWKKNRDGTSNKPHAAFDHEGV